MTDRFSPAAVLWAHWKGMTNRHYGSRSSVADTTARVIVVLLPLTVGVSCYVAGATMQAGAAMLAGVSLLAGGFLAAFSQVASWRERLTEQRAQHEVSDRPRRDALDESVAHIITAIYVCITQAVVLVIALNTADDQGVVHGVWAALPYALGTYLVLVIFMVLPNLYETYDNSNKVAPELSGRHR